MTGRDEAILSVLPIARDLARRLSRSWSPDFPDIYSDGCLGAIRAVDSYDPSKGAFTAYAFFIIRGAIFNGIRARDPVSERVRRSLRQARGVRDRFRQEHGVEPSDAAVATLVPAYRRSQRSAAMWMVSSLETAFPYAGEPPGVGSAATTVDRLLTSIAARRAVDTLPDRLRSIVIEHYVNDVPLRSIAERLRVTPQRVSQLHIAALSMLRNAIMRDPDLSEARIA